MTGNQIAKARAEEEKRANRVKENLEEKEYKRKKAETIMKGVSMIPGLIKTGLGRGKNHPAWYSNDKQLVLDAANLSYGEPLGSKAVTTSTLVQLGSNGSTVQSKSQVKTGIPGLMVLRYLPMIPDATLMKEIAQKIYAFVRHANSGHANYESNDLMMYFNAVTQTYGPIGHAMRAYSILNTYKNASYYYAEAYFKAMGLDYTSFSQNIDDFRVKINTWIRRVNSFNIPQGFSLFERTMWMNTNIFKDYPIKRSSNYIFMPDMYFIYGENENGSFLSASKFASHDSDTGLNSYTQFCAIIDRMIDAIYDSEDLGIMSGDILKAYGESGLYKLSEIPAEFHIEETYDESVLTQINGASVIGEADPIYCDIYTYNDGSRSEIRQGNKTNFGAPRFNILEANQGDYTLVEGSDNFINMYKDNVTPDDNMVATRLTASTTLRYDSVSGKYYRLIQPGAHGSEVITTITICTYGQSVNEEADFYYLTVFDGFVASHTGSAITPVSKNGIFFTTSLISSFDWAPRIRVSLLIEWSDAIVPVLIYDNIDYSNYVRVELPTLGNMHQVALMSEYNF